MIDNGAPAVESVEQFLDRFLSLPEDGGAYMSRRAALRSMVECRDERIHAEAHGASRAAASGEQQLARGWSKLRNNKREIRAAAWDAGYEIGVKVGTGKGYAEEGFSDENPYRGDAAPAVTDEQVAADLALLRDAIGEAEDSGCSARPIATSRALDRIEKRLRGER